MNNDIIEEFLKNNYLEIPNPEFAVLLKGTWGCGKTHFINKVLDNKYKKDKKKEVIFISLFGLSTIEQLNKKLYKIMHPIKTSTAFKVGAQVLKSLLKISSEKEFDLTNDDINDINVAITTPDFTEIEDEESPDKKQSEIKKLIVVDDLERCSIPIEEILGFFSELIINKKTKIIFIGDITKLNDDEEKDFSVIKEKVIGQEFTIHTSLTNVIDIFLNELKIENYKDEIKKIYLEIDKKFEISNLRAVRQSLYFLKIILSQYDKNNFKDTPEYFNELIEYYFILFYQKAVHGVRTKKELHNAISVYFHKKAFIKNIQKDDDLLKHDYSLCLDIPLNKIYDEIILEGIINKANLLDDYEKWLISHKEKHNLVTLLQNWWQLSDEDFKTQYNQIIMNFKNDNYFYCIDLLNYLSLELILSSYNIISINIDELIKSIEDYTDKNIEVMKYQDFRTDNYSISKLSNDTQLTYKKVADILKQKNKLIQQKQLNEIYEHIFSNKEDSFITLEKLINRMIGNNDFFNCPILKNQEMNKLFSFLQSLDINKQQSIYNLFKERYIQSSYSEDQEDKEKLKELATLYNIDDDKLKMSPENLAKKQLSDEYFELYNSLA